MSFTALTTGQITSGEPVAADLWTLVKNNFDDHESRLISLEGTGLTTFPMVFAVEGMHSNFGAATGIAHIRAAYNLTLTSAKLFVPLIGTSGTLTVDVQKKRGGGAFATIFSTKPSVAVAAGDYATSTNAVLSDTDIDTGDTLRLDISVVQVNCKEFYLYLIYEV